MTYPELKAQAPLILLDCISGSVAYNLNTPSSDTDLKGVFIMPQHQLYGFHPQEQIANASNDEVYFELGRFLDLLVKNNPNILELLSTPPQFIRSRHPLINLIKPEDFLSKLCLDTFAGYAQTQIKKARGLNKKINKPMDEPRRSVLDFCYVIHQNGSIPLTDWLAQKNFRQEDCGLTHVAHFRDVHLLYHTSQLSDGSYFKGIISSPDASDVQLSTVPKSLPHLAVINFNKDGYSVYCREYREYKEWEIKRNQVRYESTLSHGKNYDAKNMMHTFRLLNMAGEIALHRKVIVSRPDRDFLLSIRSGKFEFDDLMQMIDERMDSIKQAYATADLPDSPDKAHAEALLIRIREAYYNTKI